MTEIQYYNSQDFSQNKISVLCWRSSPAGVIFKRVESMVGKCVSCSFDENKRKNIDSTHKYILVLICLNSSMNAVFSFKIMKVTVDVETASSFIEQL